MNMYRKDIDSKLFNVSIDGYDLIAEEFSPSESFNRRDTSRHNIIGGTQTVMRTNYIPRDISFVAHVLIDPLFPDVYDDILKVWMSKPVEVISKELGGKFKAECIVKKTHEKPNYLKLDIQLIEIPGKSLIPNDEFKVPSANKLLKRLGKRSATKKASAIMVAPKKRAIKISRTKPATREMAVHPPTVAIDFTNDIILLYPHFFLFTSLF